MSAKSLWITVRENTKRHHGNGLSASVLQNQSTNHRPQSTLLCLSQIGYIIHRLARHDLVQNPTQQKRRNRSYRHYPLTQTPPFFSVRPVSKNMLVRTQNHGRQDGNTPHIQMERSNYSHCRIAILQVPRHVRQRLLAGKPKPPKIQGVKCHDIQAIYPKVLQKGNGQSHDHHNPHQPPRRFQSIRSHSFHRSAQCVGAPVSTGGRIRQRVCL